MRYLTALLLLLLVASAAHAAETIAEDETVSRMMQPQLAEVVPAGPGLVLAPVALAEQARTRTDLAAAQDMPRRGGMLWVIGALVVAGIILAAVLV